MPPPTPPFCAPEGSRCHGGPPVWLLSHSKVIPDFAACPRAPAVLCRAPWPRTSSSPCRTCRKVRGGKDILKGIYLSFFPGAKIGVIGPNGAGKSTLLRIMAGLDTEFFGTARPDPSIRVGFLPQEPQLDPSLDVKGNVELGVK